MVSDIGIPVGADAHLKYSSKKSFGAVLIARNPVELTAYNDESLFKTWLEDNRSKLYETFGHQLKRYGLWIITLTYTAPGCSINAWMDKDKDAVLSAKAKAAMVGDLGAELDWTDRITDKDWCHYTARPSSTIFATSPIDPTSKAEALRFASKGTSFSSHNPHTRPTVESPPRLRQTSSQLRSSHAFATNPDVRPTRSLSRKGALKSKENDAQISKIDTQIGNAGTPDARHFIDSSKSSVNETVDKVILSKNNPSKPLQQSSAGNLAARDGVVMFYDGLYSGPLEWWVVASKSVASSLFGATIGENEIRQIIPEQYTFHKDTAITVDYPQQLLGRGHVERGYRSAYPRLSGSQDTFDTDYYPETDEGVLPQHWPKKNPSFPSTSQTADPISRVGTKLQVHDIGFRPKADPTHHGRRSSIPRGPGDA